MKKLQAFIDKYRHQFDADEPSRGHRERFRKRLVAIKPMRRVNLWLVAGAAAVAGLIITASFSLMLNFSSYNPFSEADFISNNLSPEIVEIDEYYQYQINQKHLIISKMMTGELIPLEKEIAQTLNDMEQGYKSVLNDIALSPRSDKTAFVLTRYYQTQLDVLDGIITLMQSVYLLNVKF